MELLNDYDFMLQYHLGKENVVTDAFNSKTLWNGCFTNVERVASFRNHGRVWGIVKLVEDRNFLWCFVVQLILVRWILEAQQKDGELQEWFMKMVAQNSVEWSVSSDGGFQFKNHLIVPKVE